MAIGALASHVGENGLGMTVGTADSLVEAAQREFCRVVIEFRNRANRLPAQGSMTILTGNIEISMRTTRLSIRLRLPVHRNRGQQSQPKNHIPCERRNHRSPLTARIRLRDESGYARKVRRSYEDESGY